MAGFDFAACNAFPHTAALQYCDTVKALSEAPMYIAYKGRTMKAEEAIELWRKEGLSEREIKLRKFLMSLVRDELRDDGKGRPLCTRRPPPELR